ncbi:MAG: prepilin-type N-terminal cleavage/methylation domain-containing protein [Fimbriimonadaceae bacterium]|nr:prepilin-type N-terminal cleavage/methylation domain-containing protein [Fimbriimonadaceae bacterium]
MRRRGFTLIELLVVAQSGAQRVDLRRRRWPPRRGLATRPEGRFGHWLVGRRPPGWRPWQSGQPEQLTGPERAVLTGPVPPLALTLRRRVPILLGRRPTRPRDGCA